MCFFLELLAELARHRARASDPATHLLGEFGQLLRTEHDQRGVDGAGNLAYVLTAEVGASTVIVAGTAGDVELDAFVEAVSEQLAAG